MENKNLHDIIEALYGAKTTFRINPETNTVPNTVVQILSLNPRRLSFVLINTANTTIYVSPQNDVAANNGILIAPNGGGITVKFTEDMEIPALSWYAIGTAPAQRIFLLETLTQ